MTYFESEYDEQGFELPLPAAACINGDVLNPTPCAGPVHTRLSRSGLTTSYRCEAHEAEHQERLDEISERYPDTAIPPGWFDPTYAGESWDGDY